MMDTISQRVTFWSRVRKDGPTMPHMHTRCWVYVTGATEHGYRSFRGTGAHRVAIERVGRDAGQHTRHVCDNPECVRPAHLHGGTAMENSADLRRRGPSCAREVMALWHRFHAGHVESKHPFAVDVVREVLMQTNPRTSRRRVHGGTLHAVVEPEAVTFRTEGNRRALAAEVLGAASLLGWAHVGGGRFTRIQ
jgi:hypothetical protein